MIPTTLILAENHFFIKISKPSSFLSASFSLTFSQPLLAVPMTSDLPVTLNLTSCSELNHTFKIIAGFDSFGSEQKDSLKIIPGADTPFKAGILEPAHAYHEVEGGEKLQKGIHEIDPEELFKDSDLDGDDEDGGNFSSQSIISFSTPGYRGYKTCELNEEGDYVGFQDGKLVVYEGSLDTDSEWNRLQRQKETSSEDDVSSHPPKKNQNRGLIKLV